jgi:hypothetical protein
MPVTPTNKTKSVEPTEVSADTEDTIKAGDSIKFAN